MAIKKIKAGDYLIAKRYGNPQAIYRVVSRRKTKKGTVMYTVHSNCASTLNWKNEWKESTLKSCIRCGDMRPATKTEVSKALLKQGDVQRDGTKWRTL